MWALYMRVGLILSSLLTLLVSAVDKPNVIIFYVDDLGWQDVEQLNDIGDPCPYDTPNLIKLAEQGMNFSQGYSPAPSCAPSRAALLSGQHPAQTDYTHVTAANIPTARPSTEFIEPFLGAYYDLDHMTLAEALSGNGYRTGHMGKWHVGLNATAYGFETVDHTRGVHRGMGDRTKDFSKPDSKSNPLSKEKYPPVSEAFPQGISYPYDELTEGALKFMEDSKEEPFFLNLWHWMVHWPVLTRNGELLEYYCNKLGQSFPPEPGDMSLEGQQNPYFGAMVTTVDWSLGRVMDFLASTDDPRNPGKKLSETTYIFFTSDNGGAEKKAGEIISDNYPLKYGKTHTDEGGIRVPLVVAGPGIPAKTETATMVNQLDFFPTIMNLTGTEIPQEVSEKLSGVDITPLLNGETQEVLDADGVARESLFWHFPHNSMRGAIRKGDFKLYRNYTTERYSLYRLYQDGAAVDIEEQNELSENPEFAEVVNELSAELNQNLTDTEADLPYRNPLYKKAELPMAQIKEVSITGEQAVLQLSPEHLKASKAYVLYYPLASSGKKRDKMKLDYSELGDPKISYQVKVPAVIEEGGYQVSAPVSAEVGQVRFIIIDENRYCHYSGLTGRP